MGEASDKYQPVNSGSFISVGYKPGIAYTRIQFPFVVSDLIL
jgi:hypothetical protein